MEPKSPSKLKSPITGLFKHKHFLFKTSPTVFVIFLLLFLGAYLLLALKPEKASKSSKERDSYYTVIVDCGSTGTRVDVYEWMIEKKNSKEKFPVLLHSYPDNSTESPLHQNSCQYHCLQTEPGLDKLVDNISGVRASLEPLILWAEQIVPIDKHKSTPIFVLATAGLRRLKIEDSKQVLNNVEDVVKEYSFMYKKSRIRVLSGEEEAYYGWVALNYKLGFFGSDSKKSPKLGLLDLGGSSLQVVAEVDDDNASEEEEKEVMRSKIGDKNSILAYSLPAFGLNEAFDRTIMMLVQAEKFGENKKRGTYVVGHPCLGLEYMQNYTCYDGCFGHNITEKNVSQVQRIGFSSFYLVGDPDWELCRRLARAAAVNSSSLDWTEPIFTTKCEAKLSSLRGSYNINLTALTLSSSRLHALSGFFAVHHVLNLPPRANWTEIWEKGRELCSTSRANSSTSLSSNGNLLEKHCFRLPYIASLIEDSLCLGHKEIIFGPPDVSWTLGAALVEGENITTTQASHTNLRNMKFISSPVFIFLLLLCISVLVYCSQIKLPMPSKRTAAVGASLPSYIHPKRRPN